MGLRDAQIHSLVRHPPSQQRRVDHCLFPRGLDPPSEVRREVSMWT
jgi:hypothetical protein